MAILIEDPATGARREVVDWRDGSPVFADEVAPTPEAAVEPVHWLLKPGDLVADWCGVHSADGRGLLRLLVNLTLYGKLVALLALILA
jgi:hypothetical protein